MNDEIETKARSSPTLTQLRRKTVVGVLRTWRDVKSTARNVIGAEIRPSVPKEDIDTLRKAMQECLNPKGGEITGRMLTADLGRTYLNLNASGREKFLKLLAEEFDTDQDALSKAVEAFSKAPDKLRAQSALREALVTPRSTLLRQFTALPDGFKFLVDMRADVLGLSAKGAHIKGLEYDLKTILSSWFDVSLLDLVEVRWDKSPAALLEKLMEYEAVHAISSWVDLKNRLDADRRIYAFFHYKMPLEPLIFVQVAFVKGMAGNIQHLLDTEAAVHDIEDADTAIFYSISNAQKGLAGISFGNFLIKRVVAELMREFKQIKTFATLSPVPGFRAWLDPQLKNGEISLFEPGEGALLRELSGEDNAARGLLALLNGDWHKDKKISESLKPILMRLVAHYLLEEKKGGRPLDPVANFHLLNGARLERINWLADTSAKGLKQSAGLMVNYYYKLSDIDENHEEFIAEGKVVASRQVRGYL